MHFATCTSDPSVPSSDTDNQIHETACADSQPRTNIFQAHTIHCSPVHSTYSVMRGLTLRLLRGPDYIGGLSDKPFIVWNTCAYSVDYNCFWLSLSASGFLVTCSSLLHWLRCAGMFGCGHAICVCLFHVVIHHYILLISAIFFWLLRHSIG